MTLIKKTARIAALLILVLIFSALVNSIYTAWYLDYPAFNKEMNRVLDRARGLSIDALHYNEANALAKLGENPFSGKIYRLDDHIDDVFIRRIGDSELPTGEWFAEKQLDFLDPNVRPLSSGYNRETVRSGILRFAHSQENVLESTIPLEISIEELDSVDIRMKLSLSRRAYFGWTSDPSANWNDHDRVFYRKFFAMQDGQFHNYAIDGAAIAAEHKDAAEPIRKVFLIPENEEYVEIAHIRFNGKMKPYLDQGLGVTYKKINHETRKAMFVESGNEVAFDIRIPKDRPFFTFGMGAAVPRPLSVELVLLTDEKEYILLTERFSRPLQWTDYRIDLEQYAGKDARLLIRSESDVPNALLISSPTIMTPYRKPFNAMIVIEDSLRADRLSCYGYNRKTSPAKDMWGNEGVMFSRAFSQESFTRASCTSMLTSLYPGATGVWTPFDVLDNNYTTLPEILRSQGFATLLITQIVNVSEDSGLHQGFDRIIDFRSVGDRASGVYGSEILDQWLALHADQNKFIYLHLFDPHHPYDPPATFAGDYHGQPYIGGNRPLQHSRYFDPPWLKHPTVESRNFLYDEEIRYNDSLFEDFLKTLKSHGVYEDTLVVFTSDHGEFLGEHGLWGHMPPNLRQVLHIPMIMVYPAELPGDTIIDQPVQLLDIMPTILDLAAIPLDGLLLQGDSLLPIIKGENPIDWNHRFAISDEVQNSQKTEQNAYQSIIYKDYHIVTTNAINDPYRHLMDNISQVMYELMLKTRMYNMTSDPDEYRAYLNNFADVYFQLKMKRFARQFRQYNLDLWHNLTLASKAPLSIDTEVLKQLKSLGYVE